MYCSALCADLSHDATCTSVALYEQTAVGLFAAHRLNLAVAQLCTARLAGWQQGDRAGCCYNGTRCIMLPSPRNGGFEDLWALLIDGNARGRGRQQMARNSSPVLLGSLTGLADLSH